MVNSRDGCSSNSEGEDKMKVDNDNEKTVAGVNDQSFKPKCMGKGLQRAEKELWSEECLRI